ncbi:MAG TPA: nitroreductase family deazaflavin-dependent oxidoreductase [Pseudomonadales bacterium]|jgi:F420H(2)-dependent quinone reductase|nr:nitroreductase family deazaflavin-dependent oxidoreductase [Pseudomonadales bacterium]
MLLKIVVSQLMTPKGLAFDRFLVKWTGHSLMNRVFARNEGYAPHPALLLVTRGSKTGQLREVAIPYFQLDGKLMVVGSRGGMPEDPFWVKNLRSDSEARIHIRRKEKRVRARIAQGDERKALWPRLVTLVPTYARYQANTTREIPVVILDPA